VTGRENLKSNLGSSAAIVTQARVRGNPEADAYRVTVYFSDDERHVPLLITARHRAGEIRAEIASAEIFTEAQPVTGAPNLAQPAPTQPGIVLPPATRPAPPAAGGTTATDGGATAAPTPAANAALPELPFKPGDELNYNFFLGNGPQPIGTASFRVRARARYFNRDGLLFNASLQTAGAGATLFPVNDQFNSYVDISTMLPFRAEQTLAEGPRRARFVVSADQGSGSATLRRRHARRSPRRHARPPLGLLRAALVRPDAGQAHERLAARQQAPARTLHHGAAPRRRYQLAGQQIPAVELALATNDPTGDRFNLRLWVSTDKRRLPLRLTATTPLGPVRADLAIIPTSSTSFSEGFTREPSE
jgi:hypothetical protein